MYRKAAAIVSAVILMSLTGCSGVGGKDDSSKPAIKVREETLEKVKTSEADEVPEDIYVPNIGINFTETTTGYNSTNLSQFTIIRSVKSSGYGSTDNTEFNYDIADLKLEKIINDLSLESNEYYSTIVSTDEFYFSALGYAGKTNSDSFDSVFPIEIEINGEVVDDYDTTNISNYKVKGIKLTDSMIYNSDYSIKMLDGKLKFGMTKEDVKSQLGDGFEDDSGDNRIYYKVVDSTVVVEFSSNVVDTVYYIKN